MKNRDLIKLQNGLNQVGRLTGVKFGYAISKNLDKVMREVKSLQDPIKPSDEWAAIEEKISEIHKLHCDKGTDGSPLIVNNMLVFDKSADKHDKALADLEKKNQEAYDARKVIMDEYEKMLDEDVAADFVIHKINMEHVPESITTQQFFGILPIIEEE